MKVALDAQLTVGTATGIGEYVRGLAGALRARGVDVVELREPGLDPWRFDRRVLWDQVLCRGARARAARRCCIARRDDAALMRGMPVVVTVHDVAWHRAQSHAPRVRALLFRRVFVAALSPRGARVSSIRSSRATSLLGLRPGLRTPTRVLVVYPGVAADFCRLPRRRRRAHDSRRRNRRAAQESRSADSRARRGSAARGSSRSARRRRTRANAWLLRDGSASRIGSRCADTCRANELLALYAVAARRRGSLAVRRLRLRGGAGALRRSAVRRFASSFAAGDRARRRAGRPVRRRRRRGSRRWAPRCAATRRARGARRAGAIARFSWDAQRARASSDGVRRVSRSGEPGAPGATLPSSGAKTRRTGKTRAGLGHRHDRDAHETVRRHDVLANLVARVRRHLMRLHQDAVDQIGAGRASAARILVDGDRLRATHRVLDVDDKRLQHAVISGERLTLQVVRQAAAGRSEARGTRRSRSSASRNETPRSDRCRARACGRSRAVRRCGAASGSRRRSARPA